MQRNFVESMAGYSILCYLLQVNLLHRIFFTIVQVNMNFMPCDAFDFCVYKDIIWKIRKRQPTTFINYGYGPFWILTSGGLHVLFLAFPCFLSCCFPVFSSRLVVASQKPALMKLIRVQPFRSNTYFSCFLALSVYWLFRELIISKKTIFELYSNHNVYMILISTLQIYHS